jgi:hypothetical protein
MAMAQGTQNLSETGLRAGTVLTYNVIRGDNVISRTLEDVEYIRREKDVYLAISQNTGTTALGGTLESAYSSLIFKLYNYLRDVVNTPEVEIGQEVSAEQKKDSLQASRMPQDRQERALKKGIEDFIAYHKGSALILSRIEFISSPMMTTGDLDDTLVSPIDVVVSDTCGVASQ